MELLTIVEGQIEDIHNELGMHMERIARLQSQIDDVRVALRRIAGSSPELTAARECDGRPSSGEGLIS
jgi:hypothetical protein